MGKVSKLRCAGRKIVGCGVSAAMAVAFVPSLALLVPGSAEAATGATPSKVKISSVKSTKARTATIKVKKAKRAKGYQYKVSMSSSFKSSKKYGTLTKKTKSRSYTFKGLIEGKKYFAKARAYNKKGKKTLYGTWSKTKTVKVKSASTKPVTPTVDPRNSGTVDPSKAATGQESISTTLQEAISSNVITPENSEVIVNKTEDVVYKTVNDRDNTKLTLDVLQPSTATASNPKPLVVFISGGGFTSVNDGGTFDFRMQLAKAGFVVANVTHRVIPTSTFPAPLQDVKAGIRYLKANASTWGIDKNKVAVAGNSAGGYFATMAGVTSNTKTIQYPNSRTGKMESVDLDVGDNLDQSSAVNAVLDLYGVSDLTIIGAGLDPAIEEGHHSAATTEAILLSGAAAAQKGVSVFDAPEKAAAASPFTYIDKNDPPVFMIHGDKDTLVSPVASKELQKRLDGAGVATERYVVGGAGHGGPLFYQSKAVKLMTDFLDKYATQDVPAQTEGTDDTSKAATGQESISTTLAEATENPISLSNDEPIVNETENITYKTVFAGSNKTDLHLEMLVPNTKGNHPLIVFINGGGFTRSVPAGSVNQRYAFAKAGYVVASIQHRTVPQAQFPAPLQDCKAAVRWLKANADKFSIDKNKVVAMGTSSGGYFATMLGVTGNTTKYNDDVQFDVGDNLDQSSAVNGVVDYYGVSDLTIIGAGLSNYEVHKSESNTEALLVNGPAFGTNKGASVFDTPEKTAIASPFTYIDKNDPKFLIMHGNKDMSVSPVASMELYKRLTAAGVSVDRYVMDGAAHGGWQFDQAFNHEKVIDFVASVK